MLTGSTLPYDLYRVIGPTRQPQKGRWATQAYRRALQPFFFLTLSPYSSLSSKIPRVPKVQRVCPFSFSPLFQCTTSILSTLKVSVYFFFFSYFFYKMLVAILLEMHASAYFIFGIFISIYFLPLFVPCYLQGNAHLYFLFLIYECVNMREFKCYT